MNCPKCQEVAESGQRFCAECGEPFPQRESFEPSGKSRLQMDQTTVNILFSEFLNRKGLTVELKDGRIVANQGSLSFTVQRLPLRETLLKVTGLAGARVDLEVTDFSMDENGLQLDLSVGLGE